jgi:hypothetical protein
VKRGKIHTGKLLRFSILSHIAWTPPGSSERPKYSRLSASVSTATVTRTLSFPLVSAARMKAGVLAFAGVMLAQPRRAVRRGEHGGETDLLHLTHNRHRLLNL